MVSEQRSSGHCRHSQGASAECPSTSIWTWITTGRGHELKGVRKPLFHKARQQSSFTTLEVGGGHRARLSGLCQAAALARRPCIPWLQHASTHGVHPGARGMPAMREPLLRSLVSRKGGALQHRLQPPLEFCVRPFPVADFRSLHVCCAHAFACIIQCMVMCGRRISPRLMRHGSASHPLGAAKGAWRGHCGPCCHSSRGVLTTSPCCTGCVL